MADPRRLTAMMETHANMQQSLAERLFRALLGLWMPFRWWSRPDMVEAWAARSTVIHDEGLREARRLAQSYSLAVLREMGAFPEDVPPIQYLYERGNTSILDVLQRPAERRSYTEYLRRTPQDKWPPGTQPTDSPEEAFRKRLESIIEDDIQNVARDEIQRTYAASPKVTGYRRMIHPELSRTGTCGLCVVASTNTYSIEDLMPLHKNCKCTVMPITVDSDPGLQLNDEDLRAIYDAAGSSYNRDLVRLRFRVHTHGELGPQLREEGHHFKDVAEANQEAGRKLFDAWTRKTPEMERAMWEGIVERSQHMSQLLADAKLNGENTLPNIGYMGDPIEVADIDLAMEYQADLIAYARRRLANI